MASLSLLALSVALLAEGVDRNTLPEEVHEAMDKSPSSRRAWIEIRMSSGVPGPISVALLAEGVDRNLDAGGKLRQVSQSPSSRRAWIEIIYSGGAVTGLQSPSSRRAWIEIAWQ